MRVIERKLKVAFEAGKELRISNSSVTINSSGIIELKLFGNCIAMRGPLSGAVAWSLAGWNTSTTRSRLRNVVGVPVYNCKHEPKVNGREIGARNWYRVDECFQGGFRCVNNPSEDIRIAPERKPLNSFDAVMACEGNSTPPAGYSIEDCWQCLVDTGLAWSLQGFFGRQAAAMIEAGIISAKQ